MTDPPVPQWSTVCELTGPAMEALLEVERALVNVDSFELTSTQFRTLLWVRCSLAVLYGIRVDETMAGVACPSSC